jgi:hypothetical protein
MTKSFGGFSRSAFVAGFALVLLFYRAGFAQQSSGPVRMEGSVNLSSEMYSSQGIDERRPHSAYRLVFAPTLVLFDQFRLPFELYLTSEDRGFRQPFNQFGVNPQFGGWLTLHGGYFSTRISDLTFGDSRILGGGFDLTPGNLRISFLYGMIQKSVDPDTLNGFRGAYERRAWAAKVGYGAESDFHVHLNVMRAWDDSSSLANVPPDITPMENIVTSVQLGIPLFGRALFLSGEFAVSALTNNTRSPELDGVPSSLSNIFTPRTSSQLDGAASASLMIIPSSVWSVQFTGKWVGPGYVTLGYAQLPSDVMDGTIAPTIRFFENKLMLRGSLGLRYNNLRNTRLATTKRIIGNVGLSLQPAPEWGVDVQYSNYGMQSNARNDTLRIDNISQSFTLSPRYTFQAFGGTSTAFLSYSLQAFTDFNTVTGALSDNKTNTGVVSWINAWPSTFTSTTSLMYTSAAMQLLETMVRSVTETIGYSFFGNKLSTSLTAGYTAVRTTGDDGQFTGRLTLGYSPGTWGTFTMSLSTSQYNFDPSSASASYREHMGSLQYSYSF